MAEHNHEPEIFKRLTYWGTIRAMANCPACIWEYEKLKQEVYRQQEARGEVVTLPIPPTND